MSYEIQEIEKTALGQIRHLWECLNRIHLQDSHYFKKHYQSFTFEKRIEEFLKTKNENLKIFIVATVEGVLGYCISTVKGSLGEIESIYVDDRIQKSGIGTVLIERSLAWMKSELCERITVSVSEGHESVFPFYEKLGFFPRLSYLDYKGKE